MENNFSKSANFSSPSLLFINSCDSDYLIFFISSTRFCCEHMRLHYSFSTFAMEVLLAQEILRRFTHYQMIYRFLFRQIFHANFAGQICIFDSVLFAFVILILALSKLHCSSHFSSTFLIALEQSLKQLL